jgi:hypothetical protein
VVVKKKACPDFKTYRVEPHGYESLVLMSVLKDPGCEPHKFLNHCTDVIHIRHLGVYPS